MEGRTGLAAPWMWIPVTFCWVRRSTRGERGSQVGKKEGIFGQFELDEFDGLFGGGEGGYTADIKHWREEVRWPKRGGIEERGY